MGEPRPGRRLHLAPPPGPDPAAEPVEWTELHVHSVFSFLQGSSDPHQLVAEATRLGISVLGLTDRDGLYGARRLAESARAAGIGTVFGAELSLPADSGLGTPVVLARTLAGFRLLSAAISSAQLAGSKGNPVYDLDELASAARAGHWAVLTGCPSAEHAGAEPDLAAAISHLRALGEVFGPGSVYAELVHHHLPAESVRNDVQYVAARRVGTPVVATGAVHYAAPAQARLAQALAALRRRQDLATAAGHLMPAPTAHLRSGTEMAALLTRYPGVMETTTALARSSVCDLADLHPDLPGFPVPPGHTEASWLRQLAEEGCARRYGDRGDRAARPAWTQLRHELDVIERMEMTGYFLIVHDICQVAADRDIWFQGRGSAASSVVCYTLGITAVEPLPPDRPRRPRCPGARAHRTNWRRRQPHRRTRPPPGRPVGTSPTPPRVGRS
ncbi:PHP domain-containing protein [Streptacidiphilus cavernicola]|uniref:PHP domain-containing protein n=1 Tax=Streptacidiphilus cavernicola TaxID=3342716 RepID=A0ABV6VPZ7_9ACTN